MGGHSFLLLLLLVAQAKTQLCLHHPELAVETLKLADIRRVAGQPELVTFLVVQSLTYLALIRRQTLLQAQQRALEPNSQRSATQSQSLAKSLNDPPSSLPLHPPGTSLAAEAQAAAYSSAQAASDLLYLTYWRQVTLNQSSLQRFAQLNQRDFHCQFLLVRAEMAFTALHAYDQGVILEAGDQLSEDLLAPEIARAKAECGGARRSRRKGVNEENQLDAMMYAKAKQDRIAHEAIEKKLRKERHAQTRQNAVLHRHAASQLLNSSSALPPSSNPTTVTPHDVNVHNMLKVPGGSRRRHVTTVLSHDPLLRDQLVSRIAAVYLTAAAHAVSSRSTHEDATRTNTVTTSQVSGADPDLSSKCSSDSPSLRGSSVPERSAFGSVISGISRISIASSSVSEGTSTMSESTIGATARGSNNQLRCNDFIEGLSNELSCRFLLYARRPQQAINALLVAMRSYARWGALAVTSSLQHEFASEFSDVVHVLTGGVPDGHLPTFGLTRTSQLTRQSSRPKVLGIPRVPGLSSHALGTRPRSVPETAAQRTVPSICMRLNPSSDSNFIHGNDISTGASPTSGVTPAMAAVGATTGAGGLTTMTFEADFGLADFNYPSTNILANTADGIAAGHGLHLGIAGIDRNQHAEQVTSEGSVIGDTPDKVQDLDIQSIIRAIQAISAELVLPNLISKLMRIILTMAGAQRATLLSRQAVQSGLIDSEELTEWRIGMHTSGTS
jgi:hypothetical protein